MLEMNIISSFKQSVNKVATTIDIKNTSIVNF